MFAETYLLISFNFIPCLLILNIGGNELPGCVKAATTFCLTFGRIRKSFPINPALEVCKQTEKLLFLLFWPLKLVIFSVVPLSVPKQTLERRKGSRLQQISIITFCIV